MRNIQIHLMRQIERDGKDGVKTGPRSLDRVQYIVTACAPPLLEQMPTGVCHRVHLRSVTVRGPRVDLLRTLEEFLLAEME